MPSFKQQMFSFKQLFYYIIKLEVSLNISCYYERIKITYLET